MLRSAALTLALAFATLSAASASAGDYGYGHGYNDCEVQVTYVYKTIVTYIEQPVYYTDYVLDYDCHGCPIKTPVERVRYVKTPVEKTIKVPVYSKVCHTPDYGYGQDYAGYGHGGY